MTELTADRDSRIGAPFRFEYDPAVVRYGSGVAAELREELAAHGLERALVVCGSTVGNTPAVIEPVREGLGDRLAGVFAETTPAKRLSTAVEGPAAARDCDADVLVSLGGGSSLDVAKVISALAGDDRSPEAVGSEFAETGTISPADGPSLPVVAVPTTLAGADLSSVAGVTADPAGGLVDDPASGGIGHPDLMPAAVLYDPELFATTPRSVLAASAMNGFDKGIEALYAANATPITDATALRGLALLAEWLPELGADPDAAVLESVVEGTLLVQYGVSRPDETALSVIHAFGHGLTRTYDVQQGAAHAVIAPHVLRYLFERVDARRDLLADALGVAGTDDRPEAIARQVRDVADALALPDRLRDVDGPRPEEFPEVAEAVLADSFMVNAPPALDPSADELEDVLHEAW
jgi:alcohol dehydrogenase